jgi:DNA-binding FadR family transcriptional regulator
MGMQISSPTLTDRVADILMLRITQGIYPVGTKLPSGRLLAQEFDVSAAVIREATERLRTKGLIKSRQGAGCLVLTDSVKEGFLMAMPVAIDKPALGHIYELRFDIEGGAAALAAIRAKARDIELMEHILVSLEKTLLVPQKALEWDLKFHQALATATHNPHYEQLLKYLTEQWRHSVKIARQHTLAIDQATHGKDVSGVSLLKRVHSEHLAVLTAIKKGDPVLARIKAQEHLRNACERLGLDTSLFPN